MVKISFKFKNVFLNNDPELWIKNKNMATFLVHLLSYYNIYTTYIISTLM